MNELYSQNNTTKLGLPGYNNWQGIQVVISPGDPQRKNLLRKIQWGYSLEPKTQF